MKRSGFARFWWPEAPAARIAVGALKLAVAFWIAGLLLVILNIFVGSAYESNMSKARRKTPYRAAMPLAFIASGYLLFFFKRPTPYVPTIPNR